MGLSLSTPGLSYSSRVYDGNPSFGSPARDSLSPVFSASLVFLSQKGYRLFLTFVRGGGADVAFRAGSGMNWRHASCLRLGVNGYSINRTKRACNFARHAEEHPPGDSVSRETRVFHVEMLLLQFIAHKYSTADFR